MTQLFRRLLEPVARTAAVLLGVFALGVLLAACGSDDKDEDSPQGASSDNFAQSSLSQGQDAPDFTLPTSDGGTVSLSDYTSEDQPVMLFFHMAGG